jgi:transcription initiation factor TFIIIB Brf1 subunit/transcription initiation factor TFIIB
MQECADCGGKRFEMQAGQSVCADCGEPIAGGAPDNWSAGGAHTERMNQAQDHERSARRGGASSKKRTRAPAKAPKKAARRPSAKRAARPTGADRVEGLAGSPTEVGGDEMQASTPHRASQGRTVM